RITLSVVYDLSGLLYHIIVVCNSNNMKFIGGFKVKKLKRVVIKEELVALTGKVNHAIVLNQMIYWSERVKDADQFILEEVKKAREFSDGSQESEEDIKEYLKNGWIYKTSEEMVEECMGITSRQTMSRIF